MRTKIRYSKKSGVAAALVDVKRHRFLEWNSDFLELIGKSDQELRQTLPGDLLDWGDVREDRNSAAPFSDGKLIVKSGGLPGLIFRANEVELLVFAPNPDDPIRKLKGSLREEIHKSIAQELCGCSLAVAAVAEDLKRAGSEEVAAELLRVSSSIGSSLQSLYALLS